uniref:Immunoglobulin V-set domain-containing protein n=1 Tax=Seriola dumerili TaxID=41447 RepID=A0A3B4V0Q2_SERDU
GLQLWRIEGVASLSDRWVRACYNHVLTRRPGVSRSSRQVAEPEPEQVFLYRDKNPDPQNQSPSFQNRVELRDRQMKDGDVSLTLKDVTRDDTGRYECRFSLLSTVNQSHCGWWNSHAFVYWRSHECVSSAWERL